MFSVTVLFIVCIMKAKANAQEDLHYDNGWKPLSPEKVFENIHRIIIKTPDTIYSSVSPWNPTILAEHTKQFSNVKPHYINRKLMTEDRNDNIGTNKKQNKLHITEKQKRVSNFLLNGESTNLHEIGTENQREAKKLIDNKKKIHENILDGNESKNVVVETDIKEDIKVKETNNINAKSNSYEVTEASEALEVNDLLSIDRAQTGPRKPHFETDFERTTEKNLTNILLNILGNYNIRINDDLTNYELSRNRHNSNSYKQSYVYPAPIKVQTMWNSQNYFPLDPLLAVFLSNYGYYLPGFYGYPGNYHNIYGYLASNNIHNNKPFGAYKIYSDTDSSH